MENRKELILKEIVDQYISSGQPVSSKMLLEEYELSFSSATVRNDMHTLEEDGFINKPYTSGGRVPTVQGYRYFVDWLLELSDLTNEERKEVVEAYNFKRQDAERLLRITVKLLANITGQLGFVLAPDLEEATLESFNIVRLDPFHLMAVFVTELGLVDHRIIRLDNKIPQEELSQLTELLNQKLQGRKLKELQGLEQLELDEEGWYDKTMRDSIMVIRQFVEERINRRLYSEGTMNLIGNLSSEQPGQLSELNEALQYIQDQETILSAMKDCDDSRHDISAVVGIETDSDTLNYSLIINRLANCSSAVGILGPLRMDYSKSFSAIHYIGSRLESLLTVGNSYRNN